MCNKAVLKCALIVMLWVASASSVSYFYEKPKKTHDITRHSKSSSYFHFNQEVPEKVPKHHHFYKETAVRPDDLEPNFPQRDNLIEKPEYLATTEPTDYGNYNQENVHKNYYDDDKPESKFYKEAHKYYSSLFGLPEDTHKNRFTTFMEQSTPSYFSQIKLTRPKSTLRKIPHKPLDQYENPKFGENPYNSEYAHGRPEGFSYPGDIEDYKKPIEFTIPSEYKEYKKPSEFSYPEKTYPSSYRHYRKPSEYSISETAYVNEHKTKNKEPPEFSYFDEHKLSSSKYKHEFNSYKEPSVPYFEHPKPIKSPFSAHKDPFDLAYSKKHHLDYFKEAEKPPPVDFQFSYFDKKPHHSLESLREPYSSPHLGGYKFLDKPEKNEDIQEEPDFYKYKHDYSAAFKKPSSSSYFSGPKFVEKPTKSSSHLHVYEEPNKFQYSGFTSGSSNKYNPKPFREPSALSMIKQSKLAPTPALSGSYNKHKSLLDEYYKYQYKKNRISPQIIKQAFSTATPPPTTPTPHVHHKSHYDILKSNRYPGSNDVHSILSKYPKSYFNKQRYSNRYKDYKDYQENALKYQNAQQEESGVNEIPVNEPQTEQTLLPEQPKKEDDKKTLMPTIRVEDLNIQDGEVDNRDLEMMVKIVNNILQVLPYNP